MRQHEDPCNLSDLFRLVEDGHRFPTLYIDPPWRYNSPTKVPEKVDSHHPEKTYPTMSMEEIAALPIRKLAADDAHLHLWTTIRFLEPALELLRHWGFEFRDMYTWCKTTQVVAPYYLHAQEPMLLGVKGSLLFQDHSYRNYGIHPRREHSAKPIEVRKMIERVSPGPRLELFARELQPGWIGWGNEISRADFQRALNEGFDYPKPNEPLYNVLEF